MFRSIRTRMLVLIVLPTLAIYVAVLGGMMVYLRASARAEVEDRMTRLATDLAARFDGAFREAATIALTTADFMETAPGLSEQQIYAQLRANVAQSDVVYGAAMAFEPGTFKTGNVLFSPYVHRDGDVLAQMDITREVIDWYGDDRWQWWHLPKNSGKATWTDPYFDDGAGNVLMVTFSAPFERDGEFRGVTTVDIMLPTLRQSVAENITGNSKFLIMTRTGQFVYHWDESLIMRQNVFDRLREMGRGEIAEAAERIVSGDNGVVMLDNWIDGQRMWAFYAPIPSTGWAFTSLVKESDVLGGVRTRMLVATAGLALTLILIIGCIVLVSGEISKPIKRLRSKVLQIAGGDLEARVEGIETRDEVGELAQSFNTMTEDLRDHVERLGDEQARREKIERDLAMAHEVQMGLLPKEELRIPGFAVAGWNEPADETGGDYYDWLGLADGRWAVTVADVTGHGIGPALVTAFCRAYSRANIPILERLESCVDRINDLICADIPDGRFITFVIALLEPGASSVTVLSAGHGPLVVCNRAEGRVEMLAADGFPLGIMQAAEYGPAKSISLEIGDVLVLLTDGFFEWANAEGEQFGIERLGETILEEVDQSPEQIIQRLRDRVRTFVGDVPQSDDLTAVVIKRVEVGDEAS